MERFGLVRQPLQCRDLKVVDGAEVNEHHARWRLLLAGDGGDVVDHAAGVGEEQPLLGPDDQQAGCRLGSHNPWVVELVEQDQQRDEHGHQHPAKHAEGQHPGKGHQPEPEVAPADRPDPSQGGEVHQPDRGGQHDGAEDRLARSARSPVSSVRVSRAIPAVTTSASCVLAPAASLIAVWEVPPPAG